MDVGRPHIADLGAIQQLAHGAVHRDRIADRGYRLADRFLYASSRIQVSDLFPNTMSSEHRLNEQTKTKLVSLSD